MTVGTIERKHGGLEGKECNPAHEATARLKRESGGQVHDMTSEHKKAGRFPMRERVGPAKNPLPRR